jgi:hypothetical protein
VTSRASRAPLLPSEVVPQRLLAPTTGGKACTPADGEVMGAPAGSSALTRSRVDLAAPREVLCPSEVVRRLGRHGHGRALRGPLPRRSSHPAATTLLHYLADTSDVAICCSTTSNDGGIRFAVAETNAGVRFVEAGFRRRSGGDRVARPDWRSQASESSSPPRLSPSCRLTAPAALARPPRAPHL